MAWRSQQSLPLLLLSHPHNHSLLATLCSTAAAAMHRLVAAAAPARSHTVSPSSPHTPCSCPLLAQHQHHRAFSSSSPSQIAACQPAAASDSDGIEGRIGADPEEVADMLEANIYHPTREERHQARKESRYRLLTTRREALSLYREVLRYSNLFVWRDEHGRVWRDVIRNSARQEFEAARHEPDPELVNRMIVTGRDAVHRTVEGFLRQRQRIVQEESSKPQVPPM